MDKKGITFINGKDLYTDFSSELIDNSFEELMREADRKEGAENDLASHPGVQVFDDNIQPKAKEVMLTFKVAGNTTKEYIKNYRALVKEIDNNAQDGNFAIYVPLLEDTYRLRRVSYLSLDTISSSRVGKLVVSARELNPKNRAND